MLCHRVNRVQHTFLSAQGIVRQYLFDDRLYFSTRDRLYRDEQRLRMVDDVLSEQFVDDVRVEGVVFPPEEDRGVLMSQLAIMSAVVQVRED